MNCRIKLLILLLSLQYQLQYSQNNKITISSYSELVAGASRVKYGDTLLISDKTEIDFTDKPILSLPAGVILMSDRGIDGKDGALLFTNSFSTNPMILCNGDDIKIVGLRIKGFDGEIRQLDILKDKVREALSENKTPAEVNRIYVYGLPNSVGVKVYGKNIEITNCEVFNWSHAGIYIMDDTQAVIRDCYIHHNRRYGLGYGILDQGIAEIFNNTFDDNRHAVTTSGGEKAMYHAHHNTCLEHSMEQDDIFDVHGGVDRKDGTNIAGRKVEVNNNVFYINNPYKALRIRGRSIETSKAYNNILIVNPEYRDSDFFIQTRGESNLEVFNNRVIVSKNSKYESLNNIRGETSVHKSRIYK